MPLDEFPHQGEADAQASRRAFEGAVGLENSRKSRGAISGAKPIPLSATVITACDPSRRARNSILPPRSVYLAAFTSKLATICCTRTGSASSQMSPSSSAK